MLLNQSGSLDGSVDVCFFTGIKFWIMFIQSFGFNSYFYLFASHMNT